MKPILRVLEILKQDLNHDNIKTVLDLGCGSFYNRDISLFKKRDILFTIFSGKKITGIDIFDKDIAWRKIHGPAGNYICMSMLDFDITDEYDVIMAHHSLEHLNQKQHDIMFERIDSAKCKYIIIGGPIGYSDNSAFIKIKDNLYEEHKIGLDPRFYDGKGYKIHLFGPSFLAIKEK